MKIYVVHWSMKKSGKILVTTFRADNAKQAIKMFRKLTYSKSCRIIEVIEVE